jgi:hypothetical protein
MWQARALSSQARVEALLSHPGDVVDGFGNACQSHLARAPGVRLGISPRMALFCSSNRARANLVCASLCSTLADTRDMPPDRARHHGRRGVSAGGGSMPKVYLSRRSRAEDLEGGLPPALPWVARTSAPSPQRCQHHRRGDATGVRVRRDDGSGRPPRAGLLRRARLSWLPPGHVLLCTGHQPGRPDALLRRRDEPPHRAGAATLSTVQAKARRQRRIGPSVPWPLNLH